MCVCVCVYVCVCAVNLQPAVPAWWSDLGSIMSPAGFCSESWCRHQPPSGRSETICRRPILNTLLQWKVWHGLNGAYTASIDFHIWEHLYYCWSPFRAQQAAQGFRLLEQSWSARFDDTPPASRGEELWCLFRETSSWLGFYSSWMCGRKQPQLSVNNLTTWAGFQLPVPLIHSIYKLPWQFDFSRKMTDPESGKQTHYLASI